MMRALCFRVLHIVLRIPGWKTILPYPEANCTSNCGSGSFPPCNPVYLVVEKRRYFKSALIFPKQLELIDASTWNARP
jgi:hypothetical protein